jgi:hypothetical protein
MGMVTNMLNLLAILTMESDVEPLWMLKYQKPCKQPQNIEAELLGIDNVGRGTDSEVRDHFHDRSGLYSSKLIALLGSQPQNLRPYRRNVRIALPIPF